MQRHYNRNRKGRFSRKQKISFYAVGIVVTAGVLACAVVGAESIYNQLSQRVKNVLSPKVIEVTADTLEPIDMKEWVLWRVKQAGIDPYEAYAVIQRESKWNPEAIGHSAQNPGGGTDLGLWQINTKWQPQIKPSCSLDWKCSTEEAIKIHTKWKGWGAWTTAKDLGLK